MFCDSLIDFMFMLRWINFVLYCSGLKSMCGIGNDIQSMATSRELERINMLELDVWLPDQPL